MTSDKLQFLMCVAIATMAGCSGGQADTADAKASAPQAVASQAIAPASAVTSAARNANHSESKMDIAMKSAIAMHAQASIPALACGVETQANLDASKAKVRKLARAEGIDDATFDQVYAAAERQGRTRWKSAPAAKRASACEEWKAMSVEVQA